MVYLDGRTFAGVEAHVLFQQAHRVREVRTGRLEVLVDLREGWVPETDADLLRYVSDMHAPARGDEGCPVLAQCRKLPSVRGPAGQAEYEMSDDLRIQLDNLRERLWGRERFIEVFAGMLEVQGYDLAVGELPSAQAAAGRGLAREVKRRAAELKAKRQEAVGTAELLGPLAVAELAAAPARTQAEELALERQELAAYYEVAPEQVTPAFVKQWGTPLARRQHQNRKQAARSPGRQAAEHRKKIERDPRALANDRTSAPKVIALERLLRGIGFAEGVHTQEELTREALEAAIAAYAPFFAANQGQTDRALGKPSRAKRDACGTLKSMLAYLEEPLKEAYGAKLERVLDRKGVVVAARLVLPPIPGQG